MNDGGLGAHVIGRAAGVHPTPNSGRSGARGAAPPAIPCWVCPARVMEAAWHRKTCPCSTPESHAGVGKVPIFPLMRATICLLISAA